MEENLAPNQETDSKVNASDFNSQADAFLDSVEKGEPSVSATEKSPTVSPEVKDAGADQLKKASPEAEGKDETEKDPRDLMFRKGYNEAKAKLEKEFGGVTREDIENFKKVTSSPEYIRQSMKAQGYTDEAIERELVTKGYQLPEKASDDVALVAKELGLDLTNVDPNTKAIISDVAKIADVIFKNRMSKTLGSTLKPIEESVATLTQKNSASNLVNSMKEVITNEGILDFKKDIEPAISDFLDKNPEATQDDVHRHFELINHQLTIERLKTGKKQVERTDAKKENRPLSGKSHGEFTAPKKTGNFNQDADAILDMFNVQ